MAIGKSKRTGKKGTKKKAVEPMARKEWYDVVAPATFETRQFTKTLCNKTIGTKLAADNLRGRVYEANLADLQKQQAGEAAYRQIKFRVEDVQGRSAITQFYGYRLTADKLRAAVRKWCTTIENVIEAKTKDGYVLRIFVIAFTAKQSNQLSKNCYAKHRLVHWIRLRMSKLIQRRLERSDINDTVKLITNETLTSLMKKRCNPLFPLRDVLIHKIKVLRTPKFDTTKLLEAHKGEIPQSSEELGERVDVAEAPAAAATEE
jgi:small subunit ribosomal protein S3Ae